MAERDPSRTETATKRRRDQARKKGSVPKSQELTKVAVLLAGMLALKYTIFIFDEQLTMLFRWFLSHGVQTQVTQTRVLSLLTDVSVSLAKMLLPALVALCCMSWLILRLQVGKLWAPKFELNLGRMLNIMAGLKAVLFDVKVFVRLGRQMLQAIAIGFAPYILLRQEFSNMLPLFYADAHTLAAYILNTSMTMLWYAMLPMLLIAAADTWYNRWDYEENLKMTKAEVKDEQRNVEGDPEVKIKQRQKMFAIMGKRMLKNVPQADVVITNPTHFAVALQYNPLVAPAPIVVAKGADHMAQRIKEIAREHDVPIKENKVLARALYKDVEVGEVIPESLFQAVAAVLAQLSKFRSRMQR
ncbi:flagellar biosynthesis protein FlhB [Fundidesulfovibrio butyratiphilus]